jgi:hypothetical protein
MHFNPIYSLIAAVVMIILYRMGQYQLHYGLPWSKDEEDFWGIKSHRRKYKLIKDKNTGLEWRSSAPAFPCSTTWLVWITDFYHLSQAIWLKLFYLIIANHLPLLGSNFITDSLFWSFLVTWFVLGGVLWATETILKKELKIFKYI